MTYTSPTSNTQLVQDFHNLEVDQQLALFWFIYTEMGQSITPAAPGASTVSPNIAEGLFNQVKEMSHDQQLDIQRKLIRGENTLISREYGAMSDTTKLLFWYRLAQEMENHVIVPMPSDYELNNKGQALLQKIKQLDFNEQITLLRDIVAPMGVDPNAVPHNTQTGL